MTELGEAGGASSRCIISGRVSKLNSKADRDNIRIRSRTDGSGADADGHATAHIGSPMMDMMDAAYAGTTNACSASRQGFSRNTRDAKDGSKSAH